MISHNISEFRWFIHGGADLQKTHRSRALADLLDISVFKISLYMYKFETKKSIL